MIAPLIFPDTASGVARVRLDIERIDYAAPEASGRQGGVQAGWPLWSARWELDRVDPESGDAWQAFVDRLRGRQRTFVGGDTTRPFPRSRSMGFAGLARAGGGAFGGAATGWAQNIDGDGNAQIALTGLPAGLVLSRRDYIGFKWDAAGDAAGSYGRRALVRVVVGSAASAGGAITVMAEPPIDTRVVPAGAVAHLDRPCALFRLDPEETKLGPISSGLTLGGGTIAAMQDLRP